MSKFISVATQYAIYEVPDETFDVLPQGMKGNPPQIVLELMAMQGQARRLGTVSTLSMDMAEAQEFFESQDEDDEDESGEEHPWIT